MGEEQHPQVREAGEEKVKQKEKGKGKETKRHDEIADQIPPLANFRHEDIRPASGDRLGPQAKFAGETNEYKEDWGKEYSQAEERRKSQSGIGKGREQDGDLGIKTENEHFKNILGPKDLTAETDRQVV